MEHLFVYGTLQPGAPNEHVLADVAGRWQPATVSGHLVADGWGARVGYSGLVLDAAGEVVPGQILSSEELESLWPELDAFEGEEYERVRATATLSDGTQVLVNAYVLKR